jgi:Domain of unknown function (DUF4272)
MKLFNFIRTNKQLEENFTRLINLGLKNAKVLQYNLGQSSRLKDVDKIYYRSLILCILAIISEEPSNKDLKKQLFRPRLQEYFTVPELNFYNKINPDDILVSKYRWGYESSNLLAWSLGLIDELIFPDNIIDIPKFTVKIMSTVGHWNKLKFRDRKLVEKEADFNLRLLWNARQSLFVNNETIPLNMDLRILEERQKAFNWLLGFYDQWESVEIPT